MGALPPERAQRGSGVSDDILIARAVLNRLAEPACIPLWHLVREHGPVAAVEMIRAGDAPSEVTNATAARIGIVDPQADLEAAQRHGVRLIVPESDEWPHFAMACLERTGIARADLYDRGQRTHAEYGEPIPPLALWAKGPLDLATVGVRSVGIVGARAATTYGEQVAADLAYGLARRGFEVVSGGAFGIDSAAHRGALAAGGCTVVVSAGGLDRPYPPANAALFDRASESGLLLSESPPGAAPQRRRFLTRNRLIGALATGTVIAEASARSGAMNTAGHCFRLGRPVMAVPGPVTSIVSAGCHQLLADENRRASLVASVDDVLMLIGGSGDIAEVGPSPVGHADEVRARLDAVDRRARQVYDGFPAHRCVSPEDLAASSGLAPLEIIRALPVLELAGLIEATADGFRIARRRVSEPK
jgi:DNA processing protein